MTNPLTWLHGSDVSYNKVLCELVHRKKVTQWLIFKFILLYAVDWEAAVFSVKDKQIILITISTKCTATLHGV